VACGIVLWRLGSNAGHYTAYTRHSVIGEWFYFNDETVVKQNPRNGDYSNMYILFYQRRGQIDTADFNYIEFCRMESPRK